MKILYWIIGVVIIGGAGTYWYYQQSFSEQNPPGQNSVNDTSPLPYSSSKVFSEIDMQRGWYYGLLNQKKIGTPDSWQNTGGSSRGEMWYDPARPIR